MEKKLILQYVLIAGKIANKIFKIEIYFFNKLLIKQIKNNIIIVIMNKLPNELKFSIFSFILPDKLDEISRIIELANDSLLWVNLCVNLGTNNLLNWYFNENYSIKELYYLLIEFHEKPITIKNKLIFEWHVYNLILMNNTKLLVKILNYDSTRENIITKIVINIINKTKQYNLFNILNKNNILMKFASENSHLELFKWLKENGAHLDEDAIANASRYGHFEIVKWLRENRAPWDERAIKYASRHGHFEIVKWLKENGAPWDERAISRASIGGHFEIVKWLRKNGAPWDELAIEYASYNGHFEIVKWLRENGAPWDELAIAFASYNGHFEIVKWLRKNGAPWNKSAIANASRNGHFEIVKWLRENGAPE